MPINKTLDPRQYLLSCLLPWFPESLIDLGEGKPLLVKEVLNLQVEAEALEGRQFHGDLNYLVH